MNVLIKIPDNATNGDAIKMMFPNLEIGADPYIPSVDGYVGGILMMRVDRNWWNAPYKVESEQEDKQKQAFGIKVGDEVITKYAEHAVAVRDTYYIGKDREPFTLIWFGTHMSSCPVNELTKTGKHYPQIAEIMAELRRAESEEV